MLCAYTRYLFIQLIQIQLHSASMPLRRVILVEKDAALDTAALIGWSSLIITNIKLALPEK